MLPINSIPSKDNSIKPQKKNSSSPLPNLNHYNISHDFIYSDLAPTNSNIPPPNLSSDFSPHNASPQNFSQPQSLSNTLSNKFIPPTHNSNKFMPTSHSSKNIDHSLSPDFKDPSNKNSPLDHSNPSLHSSFNNNSILDSRSSINSKQPLPSNASPLKLAQFMFNKISQIIIESRVHKSFFSQNSLNPSVLPPHSIPSNNHAPFKLNYLFGISTYLYPAVNQDLYYWKKYLSLDSPSIPPLFISIYLDINTSPDNFVYFKDNNNFSTLINLQNINTSLDPDQLPNHHNTYRFILENWKIDFSNPSSTPPSDQPKIYKNSILFCKLIYSLVHLLPSTTFAKNLNSLNRNDFSFGYQIRKSPNSIFSSPQIKIQTSQFSPPINSYSFKPLQTSLGNFCVSVNYFSQCDFFIKPKPTNSPKPNDIFEIDDSFFTPTLSNQHNILYHPSSVPTGLSANTSLIPPINNSNNPSANSSSSNKYPPQFHNPYNFFPSHKNSAENNQILYSRSPNASTKPEDLFSGRFSPLPLSSPNNINSDSNNIHNTNTNNNNTYSSSFSNSFKNTNYACKPFSISRTSSINNSNSILPISPFKNPTSISSNKSESLTSNFDELRLKRLDNYNDHSSIDDSKSSNFINSSFNMPPPRSIPKRNVDFNRLSSNLSSSLGNPLLEKRVLSSQLSNKPRPLSTRIPSATNNIPDSTTHRAGISFEKKLSTSNSSNLSIEPKLVSSFQKRRINRYSSGDNPFRNDTNSPSLIASSNNPYQHSLYSNSALSKTSLNITPSGSFNIRDNNSSIENSNLNSNISYRGLFNKPNSNLSSSNNKDIANFIDLLDNKFSTPSFKKPNSQTISPHEDFLKSLSDLDIHTSPPSSPQNKLKHNHHTSNLSKLLKESYPNRPLSQKSEVDNANNRCENYPKANNSSKSNNQKFDDSSGNYYSINNASSLNPARNSLSRYPSFKNYSNDQSKYSNSYKHSSDYPIHNNRPSTTSSNFASHQSPIIGYSDPKSLSKKIAPSLNDDRYRYTNTSLRKSSNFDISSQNYINSNSYKNSLPTDISPLKNNSKSFKDISDSDSISISDIPNYAIRNTNANTSSSSSAKHLFDSTDYDNLSSSHLSSKQSKKSSIIADFGSVRAQLGLDKSALMFSGRDESDNQEYYSLPHTSDLPESKAENLPKKQPYFSKIFNISNRNLTGYDTSNTSNSTNLAGNRNGSGGSSRLFSNNAHRSSIEHSFSNIDFHDTDELESDSNILVFNMSNTSLSNRKNKRK
ncbi:Autophagy-related protein 13 [Smittium culicis]|uniref:Autophagy-related protein 13 n=1 Tax=Smittium culicis TaxID=133412 RepID=A0A1R1YT29_9FUNG|nr:Autophagy-related protein 13 [Smittium culicis]